MSATNNQIFTGFADKLNTAALGYPIAWPGGVGQNAAGVYDPNFSAPATGFWLEVNHFPNRGRDEGLAYDSSYVPEGIIQVYVCDRPGEGIIPANAIVDQLLAVFPKGETLSGSVRISRKPYPTERMDMDDRFMIPVVFEYIG
ncbi:MAG TPA: phage tail terminator-like protein [Cellvibrionaceae bacterium]